MATRVDIRDDHDVAYVTDVEGQWEKLASFCRESESVSLVGGRLEVREGHTFVFGGDAIDRGPHGLRVLRTLVEAKERQPARVILLAGNRDLNKLRLARELDGVLPRRAPQEAVEWSKPELLRYIFDNTMGAKGAFAFRLAELREQGSGQTEDDVVESFRADVRGDGLIVRYLRGAQLAYRAGATLFVHGGVTSENLGVVPTGDADRPRVGLAVDDWVIALNRWYEDEIDAFDGGRGCPALIAYQAPVPGTRQNQRSVVYGRPTDDLNNPILPSAEVRRALGDAGVLRIVVGHTPIGDVPCVLRSEDGALEVVWADCSRGRDHESPAVEMRDEVLAMRGHAVLDDGARVHHAARLERRRDPHPIARTLATGHTVRSRVDDGRYFVSRLFEGFRNEQLALSEAEITTRLARP